MPIRPNTANQLRLFYVTIFALLSLGAYSVYNTNHQTYIACKHVQSLQRYAVTTIERSRLTLPTIAYYKNPDHKTELIAQLKTLAEDEKGFAPIQCHHNIIGG